jgi:hypothetical protein
LEQSGEKYLSLGFNARKKTSNKWFETQDQISYYKEFEKEKVAWLNLNRKWKFSFVEPGIYCEASLNFLSSNEYSKVLTGILSSKVILWYFKQIGRMHDRGGFMCKIDTFRAMPIPSITTENKNIYADLEVVVNEIIMLIKENKETPSDLEEELNNLCYKLYSLSNEEISLIEPECLF